MSFSETFYLCELCTGNVCCLTGLIQHSCCTLHTTLTNNIFFKYHCSFLQKKNKTKCVAAASKASKKPLQSQTFFVRIIAGSSLTCFSAVRETDWQRSCFDSETFGRWIGAVMLWLDINKTNAFCLLTRTTCKLVNM